MTQGLRGRGGGIGSGLGLAGERPDQRRQNRPPARTASPADGHEKPGMTHGNKCNRRMPGGVNQFNAVTVPASRYLDTSRLKSFIKNLRRLGGLISFRGAFDVVGGFLQFAPAAPVGW